MKDYQYDKFLHIRTQPQKHLDYPDEIQYNPYEPTPYGALEELSHVYTPTNGYLVDYGCGKGRVSFYFHHYFKLGVKGVEMDENIIQIAIDNHHRYRKHHGGESIEFNCCLAEEYFVSKDECIFYFFNPFTIHIFRKVIQNILTSIEIHPRNVDIIMYYPHQEYIYFLEDSTPFECVQEVSYSMLYENNPDERFLIYRFTV